MKRALIPALFGTLLITAPCRGQGAPAQVCIRDTCVTCEIASSPEDRARGLMYRERLDPDSGMLFVFEQSGTYGFWMKNMRFPLDMIWITSDLQIAAISENVPACGEGDCPSIGPGTDVRYVLEVEAGFAKKHAIAARDIVTIR